MNEKSKELIVKAGFKNSYFDPKDGFEVVFVDEEHTTKSIEKLIKLVVKECAEIAKRNSEKQSGLGEKVMLGITAEQIKEKFGIK